MTIVRLLLASLVAVQCLVQAAPAQAASAPNVAAAADLKFALADIAARFRKETGLEVKLVFGSSGNLYRQIEQGAPFELFLSADEALIQRLAQAGKTEDQGQPYALGRIVLFVPKGSPLKPDPHLADLKVATTDGRLQRFAIANPEHAPYGRAAEQALRAAGAWDAVKPRLVIGENIAQAAQFATGGSAQGGMLALSLVKGPALAGLGDWVLVPEALHAPLRQRMVLVKGSGDTARRFHAYLQQPAVRDVLASYGFALPEGR